MRSAGLGWGRRRRARVQGPAQSLLASSLRSRCWKGYAGRGRSRRLADAKSGLDWHPHTLSSLLRFGGKRLLEKVFARKALTRTRTEWCHVGQISGRDTDGAPAGPRECRKGKSEVAQSCPALCDPVDCSPPGSSVHGIFQSWVLEWVAVSFSRGSSQPRDRTWVSSIER